MSNQPINEPNQFAPASERSIFLPHGRIGRVAYAVRWAATLAAYAALGSVQHATIGSEPNALVKSLSFVLFAFLVITSIKRLHDLGYGAVAVIFLGPIVPLLLFAPGEPGPNTYGNPPPKPFSGSVRVFPLAALLFASVTAHAQLAVTVLPVKLTGQKAIVPLAMRNGFAERIESARAVCFILDDQGKMVGQATQWVIGGDRDKAGLATGATNAFNFVVAAVKPFTSTNLTAKVTFSRVVLEGGRLADPKEVTIASPGKR